METENENINIDIEHEVIHTKDVFFEGKLKSGLIFLVEARWNIIKGWIPEVSNILWGDEVGTHEDEKEIIEYFAKKIQSKNEKA